MANTFKAAGAVQWQQIVDGGLYSRFGIQVDCRQRVYVCISQGAPDQNTDEYMILETERTREIVCNLASTDRVSIRTGDAVTVAVRGFRENRTT